MEHQPPPGSRQGLATAVGGDGPMRRSAEPARQPGGPPELRVRVVCHEAVCPNRRCPCLEVSDLPNGLRVITFPDSNTGEPGAELRPSFTTFVGTPKSKLSAIMPHAIGRDWKLVYWPNRRAAVHGHEAVIGRLLTGEPIDDLGL